MKKATLEIGLNEYIGARYVRGDALRIEFDGLTLILQADAELPRALRDVQAVFAELLALEVEATSQNFDLSGTVKALSEERDV